MNIISIILLCTGISLIISVFTIRYVLEEVLSLFKQHDEHDEKIAEHINYIYDIIIFNKLKGPKKDR